jgi:hypothetical protein
MPKLTLEEFAAQSLWFEHMRLSNFISEHEVCKHFRKTINKIKRGDLGLAPRSEWTAMVENWYRHYLAE